MPCEPIPGFRAATAQGRGGIAALGGWEGHPRPVAPEDGVGARSWRRRRGIAATGATALHRTGTPAAIFVEAAGGGNLATWTREAGQG